MAANRTLLWEGRSSAGCYLQLFPRYCSFPHSSVYCRVDAPRRASPQVRIKPVIRSYYVASDSTREAGHSAIDPVARCRTTHSLVSAVVDSCGVDPDPRGTPDIRDLDPRSGQGCPCQFDCSDGGHGSV